ncbi:MAG: hypothetical protein H6721_32495 [Sandaracinus sp.]|nr:hypothetical protein [Sandaracinus sp.]MCB9625081.1 hypothetical protein [Sandaracinus sp.]MCB9636856.1 hypothetical protein [Sandaracinus sp.]
MAFDVMRDMRIDAAPSPGGRGYVMRTKGLARRAGAELELDGVPEAFATQGAVVLHQIAGYLADHPAVEDEARVTIGHPDAVLVAHLVAGPSTPSTGVFGSLLGRETRTLRVVEPFEGMVHPKTLLATVMLWRARAHIEAGRASDARSELLESLRVFPGVPGRRTEVSMGFPYNWENHLAYAKLGTLTEDPRERERCVADAIARSEEHELFVLGDTSESLHALGRTALIDVARHVAAENVQIEHTFRRDVGQAVALRISPLLRRVDTEEGTLAVRQMTVVPRLFAEYQAAAPSGETPLEVVADVVVAYARRPAQLVSKMHEVCSLYRVGDEEAEVYGRPRLYHPGDRVVSVLLADLARRVYAGLSVSEVRAAYGLVQDEGLRASGQVKLESLRAREMQAYMQALQLRR